MHATDRFRASEVLKLHPLLCGSSWKLAYNTSQYIQMLISIEELFYLPNEAGVVCLRSFHSEEEADHWHGLKTTVHLRDCLSDIGGEQQAVLNGAEDRGCIWSQQTFSLA